VVLKKGEEGGLSLLILVQPAEREIDSNSMYGTTKGYNKGHSNIAKFK